MHCEISDRYFNAFFVEMQLKKENLKSVFGCPNRYSGLPNALNMSLEEKHRRKQLHVKRNALLRLQKKQKESFKEQDFSK